MNGDFWYVKRYPLAELAYSLWGKGEFQIRAHEEYKG